MIVSVMFYPHGYTGSLDEHYDQVASESEAWFATVVRHYLRAGLINDETLLFVPASYTGPVSHLRGTYPLPSAPATCAYFSLYFFPDGRAVGVDTLGQQITLEAWYLTALRDKVSRGVLSPTTRIILPNVLFQQLSHFLPLLTA